MNAFKLIAIVLIVAGSQGLIYGGIYRLNVNDAVAPQSQQQANAIALMPSWMGLAAVTLGGTLFLFGRKFRSTSPVTLNER